MIGIIALLSVICIPAYDAFNTSHNVTRVHPLLPLENLSMRAALPLHSMGWLRLRRVADLDCAKSV